MLAALYAPDGRVYDPAGAAPVVGRGAIAELFARALTAPRDTQIVVIAVTGDDAAVHFRATQSNGRIRDIIDTMTFNERGTDHRHACLRHLTAAAKPKPRRAVSLLRQERDCRSRRKQHFRWTMRTRLVRATSSDQVRLLVPG